MLTSPPFSCYYNPVMRNALPINYYPKTSHGIAVEAGEGKVYSLTELGDPVWAKNKEKIRGIFARVAERDNDWRMFLFERMGESPAKDALLLAADALGER